MEAPSVLVVGDSISNHYMEFLPAVLGDLVRSCCGGSDWSEGRGCNSNRVLTFLTNRLADPAAVPDILLFNAGLHDIITPRPGQPNAGQQAVAIETYQDNLRAICGLIKEAGVQPVWVTTTPVNTGPDGKVPREGGYANATFDRSNTTIDKYGVVAAAVMEEQHVPVLDLHRFTATFGGSMDSIDSDSKEPRPPLPNLGTYDNVHFTEECRARQASFIGGWLVEHFSLGKAAAQEPHPIVRLGMPTVAAIPQEVSPEMLTNATGLGKKCPSKYHNCPEFPLYQWWDAPGQLPAESGVARVGVSHSALCFYIHFEDSDIISTSTTDQQKMWQLGDCAEVFVKAGRACSDYWEIHTTPNGHFMDIHIPERGFILNEDEEATWDAMISAESGSQYAVAVDKSAGCWASEICIPWETFDLLGPPPAGTAWQWHVGRYVRCPQTSLKRPSNVFLLCVIIIPMVCVCVCPQNSTSTQQMREDGTIGGAAENSSTAPLRTAGFHDLEDFNTLVFGDFLGRAGAAAAGPAAASKL